MAYFADAQTGPKLYEGRFAPVHKCLTASGRPLAVEVVPEGTDRADAVEKQAALLKQFGSHVNVVTVHGATRAAPRGPLAVYTELVGGGSLATVVAHFGRLSEAICAAHARQILRGLQYLHGQAYYLGGFGLDDVLVAPQGVLKLTHAYSIPVHRGLGADDNAQMRADLTSVGRIVTALVVEDEHDHALLHDFVKCCHAQTSAGQLLQHPFCKGRAAAADWLAAPPMPLGRTTGRKGPMPKHIVSARLNQSARHFPRGSARSARPSGRQPLASGRAAPTPRCPPPASAFAAASARVKLSGRQPPTPRGVPPASALVSGRMSGRMSGRHFPTPRGAPPASAFAAASARVKLSGRQPPTPRGPPPASALASGRMSGRRAPTPRGRPPPLALASGRMSGRASTAQVVPPASPVSSPPKHDAAAAQAARHRASIGLAAPVGRTPAQKGFLAALGGRTAAAKDQGQDEAGANSAGGEAMVGGVVPKLNLGLLKKS